MTRLLLLAYGRETEYYRAVFATLSCWAWQPKTAMTATIFTDEPAFFTSYLAELPVTYQLLTNELLTELQGPQHYIHRVKASVIAQAFAEYPLDELLFIDSDTFFLAAPAPLLQALAAGTPLMHRREYRLAEAEGIYAAFSQARYPRKLLALLASRTFRLGGAEVQFHPGQSSWNSGVLGLPRTLAALLPDVLALLDALYAGTGWFTCEQLAFSLALQALGPVQASSDYVCHYWGKHQKTLMDKLLPAVLTSAFAALPLAGRLRQVRQLVPQWHQQIELDRAREGALYALRHGQLAAGLKYTLKVLLTNPFDGGFVQAVVRVLRRKARLRHARQWARR